MTFEVEPTFTDPEEVITEIQRERVEKRLRILERELREFKERFQRFLETNELWDGS